jgi:hypothetical protein
MGFGDFIQGVGQGFDEFGKNTLGPALEKAGKALHEFGREKLVPALVEAGKAVDGFGQERVGPAVEETGKWVGQHLAETAMIASGMFTFLFPAVIYGPVLAIFGFGSGGVTAGMCLIFSLFGFPIYAQEMLTMVCTGSAAAGIQAASGPVAAGSAFAVTQSAAMGGYGAMVFGAVVRAGSAVLAAAGLTKGATSASHQHAKIDGTKGKVE